MNALSTCTQRFTRPTDVRADVAAPATLDIEDHALKGIEAKRHVMRVAAGTRV
jgi:hypothetical protein